MISRKKDGGACWKQWYRARDARLLALSGEPPRGLCVDQLNLGCRYADSRRPQVRGKAGVPRLVILLAEAEPADLLLVLSTPSGHVNVEYRPETVAVKRAPHFSRNLLLERKSEERLLLGWEADALRWPFTRNSDALQPDSGCHPRFRRAE